jgi:hypothetical protein
MVKHVVSYLTGGDLKWKGVLNGTLGWWQFWAMTTDSFNCPNYRQALLASGRNQRT